jgi:hypothetical protein
MKATAERGPSVSRVRFAGLTRALARGVAFLLLAAAAWPGSAFAVEQENCVRLDDTRIIGPICKGFIRNDCAHPVDLTVRHEVALRRLVIHPVTAEGPGSSYVDAGTDRSEKSHRLEAGESQWYVHRSPGVGIEVARCRVSFNYTYQEDQKKEAPSGE